MNIMVYNHFDFDVLIGYTILSKITTKQSHFMIAKVMGLPANIAVIAVNVAVSKDVNVTIARLKR